MVRDVLKRRLVTTGPVAGLVALLAACSGSSPSTLDPQGPGAGRVATLWWFMFVMAAFVVVLVTALVLAGVAPRRRRGDGHLTEAAPPSPRDEPRWAGRMILIGGFVFPAVVVAVLWVWTVHDLAAGSATGRPAVTIDVVGHRWWWEVQYPDRGVVTANEIHIPVGRPVDIRLTTDDVLHSFWVPQLAPKTDMITGRVNRMRVQADRAGVYRGQCAEFCGLQHANMAFLVVAETPADFDRWLAAQRAPGAAPADALAAAGREVFLSQACTGCHTIRGTPAGARVGPDLTHVGGRMTLGAGTLRNTPGDLATWITDSQSVKPGNLMPPIQLGPDDLRAVIAYLDGLE